MGDDLACRHHVAKVNVDVEQVHLMHDLAAFADRLFRHDHPKAVGCAKCVMHLHTRAGIAVSAQNDGLLPISQQATVALGSLAYHDYEGIALNPDEKSRLQDDLGDKLAMILRNHGTLVAAPSIADAWLYMYNLETACQIQIAAQAGGADLILLSEEMTRINCAALGEVTVGQGAQIAWSAMVEKVRRRDPSFCE